METHSGEDTVVDTKLLQPSITLHKTEQLIEILCIYKFCLKKFSNSIIINIKRLEQIFSNTNSTLADKYNKKFLNILCYKDCEDYLKNTFRSIT